MAYGVLASILSVFCLAGKENCYNQLALTPNNLALNGLENTNSVTSNYVYSVYDLYSNGELLPKNTILPVESRISVGAPSNKEETLGIGITSNLGPISMIGSAMNIPIDLLSDQITPPKVKFLNNNWFEHDTKEVLEVFGDALGSNCIIEQSPLKAVSPDDIIFKYTSPVINKKDEPIINDPLVEILPPENKGRQLFYIFFYDKFMIMERKQLQSTDTLAKVYSWPIINDDGYTYIDFSKAQLKALSKDSTTNVLVDGVTNIICKKTRSFYTLTFTLLSPFLYLYTNRFLNRFSKKGYIPRSPLEMKMLEWRLWCRGKKKSLKSAFTNLCSKRKK